MGELMNHTIQEHLNTIYSRWKIIPLDLFTGATSSVPEHFFRYISQIKTDELVTGEFLYHCDKKVIVPIGDSGVIKMGCYFDRISGIWVLGKLVFISDYKEYGDWFSRDFTYFISSFDGWPDKIEWHTDGLLEAYDLQIYGLNYKAISSGVIYNGAYFNGAYFK